MPNPISSVEFIKHICKLLNIENVRVRRIVIDADYNDPVRIYLESFGDERLLDIQFDKTDVKVITGKENDHV